MRKQQLGLQTCLRSMALLCLVLFTAAAHAGTVVKVNGQKAFIKFSQDEFGTFGQGDLFYLLDKNGKKRAIILLAKVKGLKAIGVLKKGKMSTGYSTQFKGVGKIAKKKQKIYDDTDTNESDSNDMNASQAKWGLMGGYGVASQEVNQGLTTSSQTGSSISAKGVFDYPIMQNFDFRIMAGMEMLSVEGPGLIANTSTQATVGSDIKYLSIDALIKWSFFTGESMNFYFAGGMGIFYPLSKSSSAIVEDSIDSLVIGEIGGGVDIKMSSFIIPLDFSYYYFPSGDTVETTIMSIKTGIIWPF